MTGRNDTIDNHIVEIPNFQNVINDGDEQTTRGLNSPTPILKKKASGLLAQSLSFEFQTD